MKILFKTFNQGHLVSDKEFDRLQKGFAKVGMELFRNEAPEYDIVMVKGFSHTWAQLPESHINFTNTPDGKEPIKKPVVYYSIGTEYKKGIDLKEANEPIRELAEKSNWTVHISEYCRQISDKIFEPQYWHTSVIIPACEPNLPVSYKPLGNRLKLATTCIPRPVKRTDELERLCKKFNIELVPAYGGVSDFSYYHDCDGYIHLSRKEGMPNTVLEALSYGLPCIVTNYGGAKEAVGDAGVVINNDPEDIMWNPAEIEPIDDFLFEEAIEKFKKNLSELRMRVRERVLTELNNVVCANKFKEVFEQCLK